MITTGYARIYTFIKNRPKIQNDAFDYSFIAQQEICQKKSKKTVQQELGKVAVELKKLEETIKLIKRYKEMLKNQNKRFTNIVRK